MKNYLSEEILKGFNNYKYSCVDTSPLSNYVMHPFWNTVVKFCPRFIAPNLLTLVGFLCCFAHFALFSIYDYDFHSSSLEPPGTIPKWVWLAASILLFASHTLDGIDGKQARRTGNTGPVGELFDHGLDSWSTVFIAGSIYSTFGDNSDGYSIPPHRMYIILWSVFFNFHISHWEKYNTGIMYLPWAYDVAMVGGTLIYLITFFLGNGIWKISLGSYPPGPLIEFLLYAATLGFTFPNSIWNVYKSYNTGTGKMRPLPECLRPLVSFLLGGLICLLWAFLSPNDIMTSDPRAFFFMSGALYTNISCRLIVSQMSGTRSELINAFLIPLAGVATLVAFTSLVIPKFMELLLIYGLCVGFTGAHLHYGISVINQMCQHFHIEPFRIKDKHADQTKDDLGNVKKQN